LDLAHFLGASVYLLLIAVICVTLSKTAGLGKVLGMLVAGVIVGPYTPGPVATADVTAVRDFTELGVVLLLFVIGLEIEPQRLIRMARMVFGLGGLQVIVTGLALFGYLFLKFEGDWKVLILVAITLAFSSTALVMQLLEERGQTASPFGRAAFAVLLFQDLAVIPVLAALPLIGLKVDGPGTPIWEQALLTIAAVVALLGLGRYVIPQLLRYVARQRDMEALGAIALLTVMGAAWAMDQVGLPMELGAFLVGMMLSRSEFHFQLMAQIQPFKGLMMGLFFISVGMSIDVPLLVTDWINVLTAVIIIMAIKAAVMTGLGMGFGLPWRPAVRLGLFLPQSGQFAFVLFALAHDLGILDERGYLTGLVVVAVSMLATPFTVKIADLLTKGGRDGDVRGAAAKMPEGEHSGHVVVAGYGRMGRTLCALLEGSQIPYVAFDRDHSLVAAATEAGHRVFFGDLDHPAFLASLGIGRAKLVVLAVDNSSAVRRSVTHLRHLYPHVPLVARVRDLADAERVKDMGVTFAFPEAVEAGLQFGREVLEQAGVAADEADGVIDAVRRNDYELIRSLTDGKKTP
jgi:glutathione-regulated potassium-efflux system ancillary protein KefC